MIIPRQKCFSLRYKSLFPRVSKKLSIDESEGCIPEIPVKDILTNWKTTVLRKIWEYEKSAGKPKFTEKGLEGSIILFSVRTENWGGSKTVLLSFEPGPKLIQYFNEGWFWELEYDGQTGEFIGLSAGD